MTKDTSGFYRVDQNAMFQYAPNFVHGPYYSLLKADRASYRYPTKGNWVWFDDEATARTHFNVPAPVDTAPIPPWLTKNK